jgi:hypothetical protein
MLYGPGELDENKKTYTLDHGQGMFQGSRITWTKRNGFRLHRVSYDLILPPNIKLGYDGEYIPEIPAGCTRICGRAETLLVYARWYKNIKYSKVNLLLSSEKCWKLRFPSEERTDYQFYSIWELPSTSFYSV